MSLYYEAARFLDTAPQSSSLKSRVYSAKDLKSSAAQIHGLCIEATRWSPVLSDVIQKANILEAERKLTPALALLLAHDVLIGKRVSARKDHVLSLAINRHKARLSAEFTRARIRSGHPSVDAWKRALVDDEKAAGSSGGERSGHPRWIRVNTLVSTANAECEDETGVFHGWQRVSSLADLLDGSEMRRYWVDEHIPSLFATPPGCEAHLTRTAAYRQGRIILQDKASCFPAYLLFSAPWVSAPEKSPEDDEALSRLQQTGDIIDACAAPGNKTTHLAALAMAAYEEDESHDKTIIRPRITAVERDKARAVTLTQMVRTAGADKDGLVTCLQGQDFSRLNPEDKKWRDVTALLLDPSCSGSGIVGRDQGEDESPEGAARLVLPQLAASQSSEKSRGAKHKKPPKSEKNRIGSPPDENGQISAADEEAAEQTKAELQKRLHGLQGFQLTLLTHAFRFPAARKVVYSTCSIHAEENEQVVMRALNSKVARSRGWRIMTRAEQIEGMRKWHVRGVPDAFRTELLSPGGDADAHLSSPETLADACIRCEKGTADGTMGFFAVGFVRSDDEIGLTQSANGTVGNGQAAAGEDHGMEEDSFEGFED